MQLTRTYIQRDYLLTIKSSPERDDDAAGAALFYIYNIHEVSYFFQKRAPVQHVSLLSVTASSSSSNVAITVMPED